jgi:hypothetical protein
MRRNRSAALHPILAAVFLLFVATEAYPCTPIPNSLMQGETRTGMRIAESGNFTVRIFMGAFELMVMNTRYPGPTVTEFDLAVPANAPSGVYTTICTVGMGSATGTFTVLPAVQTPTATPSPTFTSSPTLTPTPTPPGPTATRTPTSPGATPTPTPTSGGPLPTPPTGSLRIAPDIVAEGSRRVRLIIAGSDFDARTTVSTPADIRLDVLRVLSPTRLEILVSNELGTPAGPRVFTVSTPGFPTGTVVVTVIPERALSAPVSVTTAAIVFPRRGAFVAAGEKLFARGILAVTGSGAITGSWQLDGFPYERFDVYAFGGQPVPVESRVPVPISEDGDHFLTLVVDHPQLVSSERVLIVRVARRAAQLRQIEPRDGSVSDGPRVFRWTIVPGAQAYEVLVSPVAEESAETVRVRVGGGIWNPTEDQWRDIGAGSRFWAVRPIFPVDVRGSLTPWRPLTVAPDQVAVAGLAAVRGPGGVTRISWRKAAPGLLYRLVFREPGGGRFEALTFDTGYVLPDLLVRHGPGSLSCRVEAIAPGGRVAGRSDPLVIGLPRGRADPPGLVRARSGRLTAEPPAAGGPWTPRRPEIGFRWEGAAGAAEPMLLVDGVDVTPLAVRDETSLRYVPPLPLAAGTHEVLARLGAEELAWMVRAGPVRAAAQAVPIPPPDPALPDFGDEELDSESALEWRVELSGLVTVKSDADDTAHATLSSSASFYRESAWSLEETIELAGHHEFNAEHTVQDSRSWLIRGGAGDEERWRADGVVGYAPPESVDGLQLLTAGFARGGTEARFSTPVGKFSGYTTFDDELSGLFTSTYPESQRIRLAAYDAPLPTDKFLLRGVYLDVDEEGDQDGFVSPSEGKAYGGIGRWAPSRAFALTFEGARAEIESEDSDAVQGNAFRVNLQGVIGKTSYAVNLHQTDAEFLNLANRSLTPAGQPDRRGGDAGISIALGKVITGIAYRYLENESDPSDARAHAGSLTFTFPFSPKVKATTTGLWSLDRSDAALSTLGPLPETDRTQYGGRLVLTETAGRFALSQTLSWTRLDDEVSDNNDVETTALNMSTSGNLARTLSLNFSLGATRSERALSGQNDNVVLLLQPRWTIPSIRLSLAPRAQYTYAASDASPIKSRGELYSALLTWTALKGKFQPILGVSGEWFRSRAGPGSRTDFDHRYIGTLTLRWGTGGDTRSATAFNDLEVPRLTPWTTGPADRLLESSAPFARGF